MVYQIQFRVLEAGSACHASLTAAIACNPQLHFAASIPECDFHVMPKVADLEVNLNSRR
jgi:hypothetical protein